MTELEIINQQIEKLLNDLIRTRATIQELERKDRELSSQITVLQITIQTIEKENAKENSNAK